jgi:hypothetical protein
MNLFYAAASFVTPTRLYDSMHRFKTLASESGVIAGCPTPPSYFFALRDGIKSLRRIRPRVFLSPSRRLAAHRIEECSELHVHGAMPTGERAD